MTNKQFLDKDGVDRLAQGIKAKIPTKVSQLENDSKYALQSQSAEFIVIDNQDAYIDVSTLDEGLYYNKNAICYFKIKDNATVVTASNFVKLFQQGIIRDAGTLFLVNEYYITDITEALEYEMNEGEKIDKYYSQYHITTNNITNYIKEYVHYITTTINSISTSCTQNINLVTASGVTIKADIDDAGSTVELSLPINTVIIGKGTDCIMGVCRGQISLPDGTRYEITNASIGQVWLKTIKTGGNDEVVISNDQPATED